MGVKERIYEFLDYKKIPIKSFEEKCGLSNGYVSSMRKGFGVGKLDNVLSEFPELNRDWLLYNEGAMLKGNVVSEPKSPYGKSDKLISEDDKVSMLANLIKQNGELIIANKSLAEANRQLSEANNRQTKMLETLIEAHPPLEIERSSKVG